MTRCCRLLPVDRVSGLGQHDKLGTGDMGVQIFWAGLSPDESVPTPSQIAIASREERLREPIRRQLAAQSLFACAIQHETRDCSELTT